MNAIDNSIEKYHQALIQLQQEINHYLTSIGKLLQVVQMTDDTVLQNECRRLLSIAMNEVIEIQRITTQKELLLKSKSQIPLPVPYPSNFPTTLDDKAPSRIALYTTQPNFVKSIDLTQPSKPMNVVNYILQSVPVNFMAKTKTETPLKPWLSQMVYRHSYINKDFNKGGEI